MRILPLLLALLAPQSPTPEVPAPAAPEASPAARAAWEAVCSAARVAEGPGKPISAFVLEAEVIARDGVQNNEIKVEYRYKEPNFIRFKLPSGRETGRGPGERYNGYWFKEKDEVIRLLSREHAEDRKLVDEMLAVARNFIALSDPGRIDPTHLELAQTAPRGLPRNLQREGEKLDWIVVSSSKFALLSGQASPGKETVFRVDLGIDRKTRLPAMAMILEQPAVENPRPPVQPLLIRLEKYRPQDGFLVPHHLAVHRRDPSRQALTFAETPHQDIWVTDSRLRPDLSEKDFEP